MKVSAAVQNAFQLALKGRSHSHSPYSHFAVGAALQIKGHATAFVGCNVENASFGATICAERVALHAAVAALGKTAPEFIVIVTAQAAATVPCALCLQSLAEFCSDDFLIYLGNTQELLQQYQLKDLLPHPFRTFRVTP